MNRPSGDAGAAYPGDVPHRHSEAPVTNKTAGLYLNLAKALNALEVAGEDLTLDESGWTARLAGENGAVHWDPETEQWTVVQY